MGRLIDENDAIEIMVKMIVGIKIQDHPQMHKTATDKKLLNEFINFAVKDEFKKIKTAFDKESVLRQLKMLGADNVNAPERWFEKEYTGNCG